MIYGILAAFVIGYILYRELSHEDENKKGD